MAQATSTNLNTQTINHIKYYKNHQKPDVMQEVTPERFSFYLQMFF